MSNEDRHAISGFAFLIDGGAVSWSSKRQSLVTLSTTEAEYVAATHLAQRIYLQSLPTPRPDASPFRFPIRHHSRSQRAIPRPHKAHRHPFSLYPLCNRSREDRYRLLPYRRYGRRYSHESSAKRQGQTLCVGPRPSKGLRGSVGKRGSRAEGPAVSHEDRP